MTIVQKTSSELASAQLARFLKLHLARRQETADPQSCRGCPRDRWGEAREQHVRTGSDTLCLAKQRRPWHPNARLADCDNTHNRSPPPSGRRRARWDPIGMCLLVSLGSRRSGSTPGLRAGATTCARCPATLCSRASSRSGCSTTARPIGLRFPGRAADPYT